MQIPVDAGDFRLVDRLAVDAVGSDAGAPPLSAGHVRLGRLPQAGVLYDRAPRHAGRTKFSFRKMVAFAADGIVSFSPAPLRLALAPGFVDRGSRRSCRRRARSSCKLTGVYTMPGWASIVVGIAFLSGVQLTVIGFMGEYVARIYEEVKGRPLYLVRDALGVDPVDAGVVAPGAVARSESSR